MTAPSVGQQIPVVNRHPNELSLFLFSAATWNAHRIHYDRDYARSEGHADLVVHGSLQGNWLVQALTGWLPDAELKKFSFRNVATAYVNQPFEVGGVVESAETSGDRVQLECKLWVNGPDGPTTTGRGTVVLTTNGGR